MEKANIERPPYRSVPQMLQASVQAYAEQPAVSYKKGGGYLTLSYQQLYTRILMAARGLRKAGMQPGDRVAIFSENRVGWAIADLGIQCALGISVPIYATNTGKQAAYVINHSGAKIVFVSDRLQYEKLLAVREQIPQVEMVVSFERFLGERNLPVYTLYQLSEISHPIKEEEKQQIEGWIASIAPDDLITVIYTSGTTGDPKGVMLTHFNMLVDAWYGLQAAGGIVMGTFLSFLPLSHVLERSAGYHAVLMSGGHIAFAESISKVLENIEEVKPTAMVSVPRLFEKLHSRVYESVHKMSPTKRRMFHKAIALGRRYIYRKYVERQPTGLLGFRYQLYDKLLFRKIRNQFGSSLKFFICGGAPLDKTINEFMWIIGLPVLEGYGLTETSPAVSLNNLEEVRFGSVGKPLHETEFKLAEDGELLIKGPQVMLGYYREEQATRAAIDDDGWLKTGDIARIDEEGYLYIIDRKKEIIVTAGGKNIPPQPLENSLKLDKYISQAFVYGDRKPYLIAIVTPNLERLLEFAHEQKLYYLGMDDLVANREVLELFSKRIEQFNSNLAGYETIKKFVLLPREFSTAGGELTPTMKLRRKVIYDLYQDKIEHLYLENGDEEEHDPSPDQGGSQ